VEVMIRVPPTFLEACGYRGTARYVGLRWLEDADELWLTDDGHCVRGNAAAMALLWRGRGGKAIRERICARLRAEDGPPWLLVDRRSRRLTIGNAVSVWRVIGCDSEGRRQHA
jgi:hypothetical protein